SMTAAFGRTTAHILIEIGAVHFRPQDPFILTSGRASPVYIDCRKVISFPRARRKIVEMMGEMAPGCRCLLVEDLATDGGSKLNFIEAIRQAEGLVADALVVFHYGIFPQ